MSNSPEPRQILHCRIFALLVSALSLVIGLLVLAGWALRIPARIRVLPSLTTVKPNTAICLVLSGLALWLLRTPSEKPPRHLRLRRRLGRALGAAIALMGFVALAEYLSHSYLGFDELFFRSALAATGEVNPWRMSVATAIGFLLLGMSLFSLASQRPRTYLIQTCGLLVVADGLVTVVGDVYGVEILYGASAYSSMAWHASVMFVLLGLATLAIRPQAGWMAIVSSERLGGLMARRILPFALVLPILAGWLRWQGEVAGLYSTRFGLSLFVLSNVAMFAVLLLLAANWINRVDEQRRRAEDSDLRLAAIVQFSIDAIIGKDLNGIVSSWNNSAQQLFGYSAQEIIGRPFSLLIPKERRAEEQRILELIRLGQRVEPFDTIRVRKDGRPIEVSVTVSPVKDAEGRVTGAAKIARDITESKRAAEELRQQAEVLDLAQVMVRDMDDRIVLWNTGAQALYGFTRGEAIGKISRQLLNTEFPSGTGDIGTQIRERGRWQGELIHTRSDGREIIVSSVWVLQRDRQGRPLHIVEADVDVTERKLAEQQLALQADELARQSEHLAESRSALHAQTRVLQSVLDSIGDGLIAADPEGEVLLWNPAADRIFCRPKNKIPIEDWSRHHRCFLSDQVTLFPSHQLPLALAIRGKETTAEMFVGSADSDRGAWIEATGRTIRDDNGAVLGGVVAFHDITLRKLADREIRRLNSELEQRVIQRTAQLAAINQELEAFSYSVSHDLRAPLRHISGFAAILREDFASGMPPTAQDYLLLIEDGAAKMGSLIDELLNLSRLGKQPLTCRSVGLNPLIAEIICILEPETAGRHIEWRIANLSPVECDAVLIKQIFQNLLSNALKYTRTRSTAVIEIGEMMQGDGGPVIFIRDNGVGFDMKYADRLFGAFQRLHRKEDFEGIGIGLATVLRIVQKHGGRLWAEAEPERGATFYFTIGSAHRQDQLAVAASVD